VLATIGTYWKGKWPGQKKGLHMKEGTTHRGNSQKGMGRGGMHNLWNLGVEEKDSLEGERGRKVGHPTYAFQTAGALLLWMAPEKGKKEKVRKEKFWVGAAWLLYHMEQK